MKKDFLTLLEYSKQEIEEILRLGSELKKALTKKKTIKPLEGKTIALIFEKPSLRTHCTFDTGIWQLGGHPVYLPSTNIRIGNRESVEDVGRNLERWVQGIVIRTFSHQTVEKLAETACIPVINALTDEHHPCQALATGLTMKQHFNSLCGLNIAFIGDGNNVAVSLFILCAKLGINARLICPKGYGIGKDQMSGILQEAKNSGAKISTTHNLKEGLKGANLIYTDVWTSMGQEKEAAKRRKIFSPYRVTSKLLSYAEKGVKFSHCLPAHRGEEVTSEVLDSPESIAFDEAENRLHVQKAVLLKLIK